MSPSLSTSKLAIMALLGVFTLSFFSGPSASAETACRDLFGSQSVRQFKSPAVDQAILNLSHSPVLVSPLTSKGKSTRRFVIPLQLGNGRKAALTFRVPKKRDVRLVRRWGGKRSVQSRARYQDYLEMNYINSLGNLETLGSLDLESRTERKNVITYRYSGEIMTSQGSGVLVGKIERKFSEDRGWYTDNLKLEFRRLQSADEPTAPETTPEEPIQVADDLTLSPAIEALIGAPDLIDGDYVEPRFQNGTGPMKFSRTIKDVNGKRAKIKMQLQKTAKIKIQAGMSVDPSVFLLKVTSESKSGKELSSLDLPFDRIWSTSSGRTVRYKSPVKTATQTGTLVGLIHQEISYQTGRARWETKNLEMRFIPESDTEVAGD